MKHRGMVENHLKEKPTGSGSGQPDAGSAYGAKAPGDNEERYRLIVNTADEGIWVLDEQYLTTFVNRRMADMLGYSRDEMDGKSLGSFLFEEDLPDYEAKVKRRRDGIAERYERKLRRKDGGTLWVLVSATPIMDKEKQFQGSFAMYTDITERKQAENALLQSEAKYRSIFENAVEGMFQSTPEGRLISANPAMVRIFGYASPEEMISMVTNIGHQLYVNTDDRRAFMQLLEHHGITGGFESQFYRKDGSVLWGSLNVRAVKDPEGTILYYEGTLMDITARKNAEEELKKSEEKYRNIFENAVEGIFQVTADGRYMSVNPALARIHGYSSPEEMVNSVTDIAHQLYVDPSRRDELMRLMKEKGFVKGFEIMMRRKDGGLQWVSMSSHAIQDVNGTVLYHEGTLEDITSRKLGDEELKQLRKTIGGTIKVLSSVVETRDPAISGHQAMVSRLATELSQAMELPQDMIKSIGIAGLIHDIGKVSIPVEILSKPSGLTGMEYNFIKLHPQSGYDILKEAELPYPVAEIILQHHERLDGSGYPKGLKGNEILREARILAVADVVAAMVSPRTHRPGYGIGAALDEIEKNKGLLYDFEVADVCLRLFKDKGFRF
ncbi:MAG: Cyclic di-GMP phosphodiesterase response regulator RpfG [Syntrophorhabdus sp. PtaU1.Bin153]|nr:MAG: Cyclic di-GMP phosphodiesterase response regulator RpfG [Syntrophorhabdus sp. PtaU1.Bin153]